MQENHLDDRQKVIQSFEKFKQIEDEHLTLLNKYYSRARKLYPKSFEWCSVDFYSYDDNGIIIHVNIDYNNEYAGYVHLDWKYINMSDEEFETELKTVQ